MTPDFKSSESSCADTDDEEDTLVKRLLTWQAQKVTEFFYKLDGHSNDKSTQAKQQTKARILSGEESIRVISSRVHISDCELLMTSCKETLTKFHSCLAIIIIVMTVNF